MSLPTVSVIMATYNHADFVEQAIESVLTQQGVEFEFLIVDDGSSDQTRELVASIKDVRIQFFPNEVNRGACVVANELIELASGEFIALINSDDYWTTTDKLAYQVQIMRERPSVGACFGRARFVDRDGRAIDKSSLPFGTIFDQENRSQGQWLRRFFDLGNCICHPTMLIRKSCFDELGMYNNRLRQLPDLDMWIRLVKHYDIYISDKELTAFRKLPGQNASDATAENMKRILNESYFILKDFFDEMPSDVFFDGFGDLLINKKTYYPEFLEIEKAFIYLSNNRWAFHIYNLIGLDKIFWMLNNQPYRELMIDRYAFDDRAFHALAAKVGVFDQISSGDGLSSVRGDLLIAEVFKRCLQRSPRWLKPILGRIIGRTKEGV
ncbi:glycosyl transferase [Limnohabitans sp. Rim8]|uniref:glycosyltransferase n=1 Tax=Limnohabitans sp. Rim8 TaxID=1100718 RepID=UPI000D38A235|nr:glycosyltransferase [Limnohabitans sp. Rim8]PUE54812.1 glycosyl transferase [Limnohabitans sp. Rim8]